jgi:hypothetical protein
VHNCPLGPYAPLTPCGTRLCLNTYATTSLHDLARMINQSFTTMQRHIDGQLAALEGEMIQRMDKREKRMDTVEGVLKDMAEELTATHADGRSLRRSVAVLVRHDAAQDAAINTPTARVTRPEKKAGLVNCARGTIEGCSHCGRLGQAGRPHRG